MKDPLPPVVLTIEPVSELPLKSALALNVSVVMDVEHEKVKMTVLPEMVP